MALEVARGSMVLLKNSGNLLPLDETKVKTIAVIGPDAYPAVPAEAAAQKPSRSTRSVISKASATVWEPRADRSLDEVSNSEFLTTPMANPLRRYFPMNLQGPVLVAPTAFRCGKAAGDPDHFSIRWTGYFVPQKSGDYKFFTSADDGVRLFIDDDTVIDDWQRHSRNRSIATPPLWKPGRPTRSVWNISKQSERPPLALASPGRRTPSAGKPRPSRRRPTQ